MKMTIKHFTNPILCRQWRNGKCTPSLITKGHGENSETQRPQARTASYPIPCPALWCVHVHIAHVRHVQVVYCAITKACAVYVRPVQSIVRDLNLIGLPVCRLPVEDHPLDGLLASEVYLDPLQGAELAAPPRCQVSICLFFM